jgi:hypothetical protein
MGSLTGAVLGAVVITIMPELLRQMPGDLSRYRLVVYSALLIVIILTRPQGILGTREFGLSWLKRSRKRPEGAQVVGGTGGVSLAERDAPSASESKKDKENR